VPGKCFIQLFNIASINKRFIFRYRASTHYRPELTPTERAHKLTLLLQHAAMLIRHTVQDRSTDKTSQAFWLANASELLHFLKSDRHVSAFSLQAQDTLADAVQLAFKVRTQCFFYILYKKKQTCPVRHRIVVGENGKIH